MPEVNFKETISIEQFYLPIDEKIDGVIRYRKSYTFGNPEVTFEKIIKQKISAGINKETDMFVTGSEYMEMLYKRDRNIAKTRSIFYFNDLKFEVDKFYSLNLIICEIELKDIEQEIIFPDEIKKEILLEITSFTQFSNYNLAL